MEVGVFCTYTYIVETNVSTPLNCDLYSTWNCFVSGVSMSWCSFTLAMKRGWSKRLHFSYFFVVEFSFSVSRWSIWFIFDVLVVVFSTTRGDIKVAKLLLRVLLLVGGEVKETYQKSNHSNINWSRDNSGIRATVKRFQPFVITLAFKRWVESTSKLCLD